VRKWLDQATPIPGLSLRISGDQGVKTPLLPKSAGARLLIVDDELAHREVLAMMMGQAGMACTTAPGAEEALSLLQTEPIDAVIADLNMPTGETNCVFSCELG
jgi:PleD family two-component response regulator